MCALGAKLWLFVVLLPREAIRLTAVRVLNNYSDIWQRARGLIELQVQLTVGSVESALRGEQLASSEHWRHWTAVPGVNEMFRGGLGSGEQRWQVVYGNEPIYT